MIQGTPSDAAVFRKLIEERERSIQTQFVAKVVTYDASTGTVRLEPQTFDVWHDRDGDRTTNQADSEEENYIENVPVCFPRSGSFSITFPIAEGSFGLVICTKHSLDLWRQQGTAGDPGDLRRFTVQGATFHPVNLYPEASQLTTIDTQYIILSEEPSNAQFVALKEDVDDIKTMLDDIKGKFNDHTHKHSVCSGGMSNVVPNAGTSAKPSSAVSTSYTVTASKKTKVE